MEVICIYDDFTGIAYYGCAPEEESTPQKHRDPIKDEICIIEHMMVFDGVLAYRLKGFDEDIYYDYYHFAEISNLGKEINEALKAKNPNIKKYPLRELEEIGYPVNPTTFNCPCKIINP